MFCPSGCQVYSSSGQPIGRVEQSHGDILSDGSSCGARAMLPNCQADFRALRRGEESQTNRVLAQSPISKLCRRAWREPPWGSQEAEMKQKARSNLFVVARSQFFSAARLKGRTVRRNEKGITSAAQIWRPLLETGLRYQSKREGNKANIVILCRTWVQVSFVQSMVFVWHATIHDRHTSYCRSVMVIIHTISKAFHPFFISQCSQGERTGRFHQQKNMWILASQGPSQGRRQQILHFYKPRGFTFNVTGWHARCWRALLMVIHTTADLYPHATCFDWE